MKATTISILFLLLLSSCTGGGDNGNASVVDNRVTILQTLTYIDKGFENETQFIGNSNGSGGFTITLNTFPLNTKVANVSLNINRTADGSRALGGTCDMTLNGDEFAGSVLLEDCNFLNSAGGSVFIARIDYDYRQGDIGGDSVLLICDDTNTCARYY